MPEEHQDDISTGRTPRPADSVAGALKTPRFLESATVKLGHAFGERLDRAVRSRHRQRLRRVGWERALDVSALRPARGSFPTREGNRLDLLVDGAEALPAIAAELACAESYVHLAGWFFSPELDMSRDDEPKIVRNLLAELAKRVDVRVLSWKGAPVPLFKPSQRDVREMLDGTRAAHEDRGPCRRLHRLDALPPREDDRDRRQGCDRRGNRPDLGWWRSMGHPEPRRSRRARLLEGNEALTHRLVKLPGVSRRRRRLIGPFQSRLYDV